MADREPEFTQPTEPSERVRGRARPRTGRRERVAPGERARFKPLERQRVERPRAREAPEARMERTAAQNASIGMGAASLAIGALGFFAPVVTRTPDRLINTHNGKLLGIFAINPPHALVHLGLGAWGLAAGRSDDAAQSYLRASAAAYGALGAAGWIKGRNRKGIYEFMGMALNTADNVLHTVWSGASAFFATRGREREIRHVEPEAGRRRAA